MHPSGNDGYENNSGNFSYWQVLSKSFPSPYRVFVTHLYPAEHLATTPYAGRTEESAISQIRTDFGIYKGPMFECIFLYFTTLHAFISTFLSCILVSLVSLLVLLLLKLARNWPWSLLLVLLLTATQANARMMCCTLLQESKRMSRHSLLLSKTPSISQSSKVLIFVRHPTYHY